jgi:Hsp70 protein/TIR domain/DnaJ C terminal domain
MARVFISYRRSDARWAAGRLYDRLAEVLGRNNVFFDVSNIEPGEDYQAKIIEIVGSCDVLLTVIGPNWLHIKDKRGAIRLDDPRDLMRIEVGTALRRNIRVIPVLVDGAQMPDEHQLPLELAPLARRNARDISFERFHADLDSFVRTMESILGGLSAAAKPGGQPAPAQVKPEPSGVVAAELPFTISLETAGGLATPLLRKGKPLPAAASEVFSTAEDNQSMVDIKLFLGDRALAKNNVSIGTFTLPGILAAPRGEPQIKVQVTVDARLVLTVSAEDASTGHKEILDAVDLSRIEIPAAMREEVGHAPQVAESPRDSPLDLSGAQSGSDFKDAFGELFGDLFGKSEDNAGNQSLDRTMVLNIGRAEAVAGAECTIELEGGRKIKLKVPAGTRSGQVLRLRGQGEKRAGKTGDLYVNIVVAA